MRKLRLLIADDEPDICHGLLTIIDWDRLGFEVAGVFSDGREILDFLKTDRADVLLADIVMNQVTGLEAAGWIRRNRPEMKVLLFTSYSEFQYAREAVNLGVYHFFSKPVEPEELTQTFSALAREMGLRDAGGAESTREEDVMQLLSALEAYVKEHLAEGVTLEDASRFAHFSPSYLSRLFKKARGLNFSDYIFQLQMEGARDRLLNTDLLIYEIARQVGFRDVRHFIKVFRKEYGRTPAAYRRYGAMRSGKEGV